MVPRKTDEERLKELEAQIEKIKAKKQQIANRIKEKERKERTRRLIQIGAIFEKYFNIEDEKQAEKIAYGMKDTVKKHKEKLLNIDVEKSKGTNSIVYETNRETC
jgi:hypothetical protein